MSFKDFSVGWYSRFVVPSASRHHQLSTFQLQCCSLLKGTSVQHPEYMKNQLLSSRNRSYCEQTDGVAMGSSVLPVVVNIYMKMFEKLALRTTPRICRCYGDNTFCVTYVDMQISVPLNILRPTMTFNWE